MRQQSATAEPCCELGELANGDISLESLWGRRATELRERVREADTLERKLAVLESMLTKRIARVSAGHRNFG